MSNGIERQERDIIRRPLEAIVIVGIRVSDVDELIAAIRGGSDESPRWFVFSREVEELQALNEMWKDSINLVLCGMPVSYDGVVDVVLTILDNEGVSLDRTAWLDGLGDASKAPPGCAVSLPFGERFQLSRAKATLIKALLAHRVH